MHTHLFHQIGNLVTVGLGIWGPLWVFQVHSLPTPGCRACVLWVAVIHSACRTMHPQHHQPSTAPTAFLAALRWLGCPSRWGLAMGWAGLWLDSWHLLCYISFLCSMLPTPKGKGVFQGRGCELNSHTEVRGTIDRGSGLTQPIGQQRIKTIWESWGWGWHPRPQEHVWLTHTPATRLRVSWWRKKGRRSWQINWF